MSARMWHMDSRTCTRGLVHLHFSFVANGSSDPTLTYATTTSDTMGNARGNGVSTVTHSATGDYLVTLADGYRGVIFKTADMEDLAPSSDDGAYATIGPVSNEGSGNSTGLTFHLFTRAATGTKTDYTSRRVSFYLVLKDSMEGR